MSQVPKNVPVSGLQSLRHKHSQANVCEPKQSTHTHTQQPGEVCVCGGARQQLSVLLQQSTFIKPNKQKHLVCDVTLQCTNQTTQLNRERERGAALLQVCLFLCLSVHQKYVRVPAFLTMVPPGMQGGR